MTAPSREVFVEFLKEKNPEKDSYEFCGDNLWKHEAVVGLIKSLESTACVTTDATSHSSLKLTAEAEKYLANGSPEAQVANFLKTDGPCTKEDIKLVRSDAIPPISLNQSQFHVLMAADSMQHSIRIRLLQAWT